MASLDFEENKNQSQLGKLGTGDKNTTRIRCERCNSLIISPGNATYATKEIFLPHMKKKSDTQKADDGETLNEFWLVDNMFTFDNVGFSKNVGTYKFLICADCEVGPIGWHDTTHAAEFYVALDRVAHQ